MISKSEEKLTGLKITSDYLLDQPTQFAEYTIIFIPEGEGIYHADFASFPFTGPVLLFSTPLQVIYIEQRKPTKLTVLQFHGDFYCIEYHRSEVACNGLLFNNIYIEPSIKLTNGDTKVFDRLLGELLEEFTRKSPSDIVLKAYLQLFLAKSGSIKIESLASPQEQVKKDELMERFRQLLDQHYLSLHKPQDYADLLAMSSNNLTKRCTRYFRKTPSQLIQERLILEAKRQLHLTRLSVKEIAHLLKFNDEFYFSRFFKKMTKVSPLTFREKGGISIVADLSMQ